MAKVTPSDSATLRVRLQTDLDRALPPEQPDLARPTQLQVDATFTGEKGAIFLHVQADALRQTFKFESPEQLKAFLNDQIGPVQLSIAGAKGNEELLRLVQSATDVRDLDNLGSARGGMIFRGEDQGIRERAGIAETTVDARSVAEGAQGLVRQLQRFLIENGCLKAKRGGKPNDDGVLGPGTRHGFLAFFRQNPATYSAFLDTLQPEIRAWFPPIEQLQKASVSQIRGWARREVKFPVEALSRLVAQIKEVGTEPLKGTVTREGIRQAEALAAFQALRNGTSFDSSGRLVVRDNELTQAQFEAAVKAALGEGATLDTQGRLDWSKAGVSAKIASQFKAIYDAAEIDAEGRIALDQGKIDADLRAAVEARFGPFAAITNNRIIFDDGIFQQAQLDDKFVGKLGRHARLKSSLKGTITRDGIEKARMMAAFKTLVGHTKMDTQGKLEIKKNELTKAQFKAALETVFGEGVTLDTNGRFDWSKKDGVSAEVASHFKAVYDAATIDAQGRILLDDGTIDGELRTAVTAMFGPLTAITNNRVVFDDGLFTEAQLDNRFVTDFGDAAKLDTSLKGTITREGIKHAEVLAAFKSLLGNTTIDANGKLIIEGNKLTRAQLDAATKTIFGQSVTLDAQGRFDWSQRGIWAEVAAQFRAVYEAASIDAQGRIALDEGTIDADLTAAITATFGPLTGITNNRIVFDDGLFQVAELDNTFTAKLGEHAALDTALKGTITREGIKNAEMLAAFKTLVGATTIDSSGKLVIKDNKLTRAQMQAAVSTVFGEHATLDAQGRFDWSQRGINAELAAQYRAVYDAATIDADGMVSLTQGRIDAYACVGLEAMFGNSTIIANNRVVFEDGMFSELDLDDKFTAKFGENASLRTSLAGTVTREGIKYAETLAAFKTLVGNTEIGSNGKLVIKENRITQVQLETALKTMLDEGATLDAQGQFDWTQEGISGSLAAQVKAVYEAAEIDAQGHIALTKAGQIDADLRAAVTARFGPMTAITNNRIVFDDGLFDRAQLDNKFVAKLGEQASLSTALKGAITREGIKNAEALAAFKTLLGNTELDANGRLVIKENRITQAQLQAATMTLFGDNVTLDAQGGISWSREHGISAEAAAQFKAVYEKASVDAAGHIRFLEGAIDAQLRGQVTAMLGSMATVTEGRLVLDDGMFQQLDLSAGATRKFGQQGSIEAQLTGTVTRDGIKQAEAMAALKMLVGEGATVVHTSGRLVIENNKLTRAQLQAAVGKLFVDEDGNQLGRIDARGRFVWEGGSYEAGMAADFVMLNEALQGGAELTLKDGQVSGQLKAAYEAATGTRVEGELTFADGDFRGFVSGVLERRVGSRATLTADAKIRLDSDGLNLEAMSAGIDGRLGPVDLTGNLQIKDGRIQQLTLTSGLIHKFDDTNASIGANAVVFVNDSGMGAQLDATGGWGPLSIGAGIGAQYAIRELARTDDRLFVEHTGIFKASGKIGGNVLVPAGPISLGFSASAEGSKSSSVRVVTSHPLREADEALRRAPMTTLRTPTSASDCDKLLPHESFTRQGEASWGLRTKVSVGYGVGPAAIGVHGEAYVQAKGIVNRTVERLPFEQGNKVRVKLTLPGLEGGKSEKVKAKAFGIGVNLTGEALKDVLVPDAIKQKATPMVETFASIGFQKKLETIERGDTVFEAVFDLDNPKGRELLNRTLNLETSSALLVGLSTNAAAYGVEIKDYVQTDLRVESSRTDFNVSVLNTTKLDQIIREEIKSFEQGKLQVLDTTEAVRVKDGFWSWSPDYRLTVDFYNARSVHGTVTTEDLGEVNVHGALLVKQAPATKQSTLATSPAALATKITIKDPVTSESNVWDNYLNLCLTLLRTLEANRHGQTGMAAGGAQGRAPGSPPVYWEPFADLFEMVREEEYKLAPERDMYTLVGDERYKKSQLDLELLIVPRGIANILMRKPTQAERAAGVRGLQYRTAEDFKSTYIEMEGNFYRDKKVISSLRGIVDHVADALDARPKLETVGGKEGFTFTKNGRVVDFVLMSDLRRFQRRLWQEIPRLDGMYGMYGSAMLRIARSDGKDPLTISVSRPRVLFARKALRRAERFGSRMGEVEEFFKQTREQGKDSAYWNDPERYYNIFEDHFEAVMKEDDWKLVAPLVWAELAGAYGVYFRGGIDFSDEVERKIAERAEENVLAFGAFCLLKGRVSFANDVLTIDLSSTSRTEKAAINAAARRLFGDKVVPRGGTMVVDKPEGRASSFARVLSTFGTVSQVDLDAAFGRRVAVYDAERGVVFDNRPYDFFASQVAGTLEKAYGATLGMESLATVQPWGDRSDQKVFHDGRVFTFEHRGRGVDDEDLKVFNHTVGYTADVGPQHDALAHKD